MFHMNQLLSMAKASGYQKLVPSLVHSFLPDLHETCIYGRDTYISNKLENILGLIILFRVMTPCGYMTAFIVVSVALL